MLSLRIDGRKLMNWAVQESRDKGGRKKETAKEPWGVALPYISIISIHWHYCIMLHYWHYVALLAFLVSRTGGTEPSKQKAPCLLHFTFSYVPSTGHQSISICNAHDQDLS